ncbi:MAG: hypothetical protein AAGF12_13405 [Myxococcota bacterium]
MRKRPLFLRIRFRALAVLRTLLLCLCGLAVFAAPAAAQIERADRLDEPVPEPPPDPSTVDAHLTEHFDRADAEDNPSGPSPLARILMEMLGGSVAAGIEVALWYGGAAAFAGGINDPCLDEEFGSFCAPDDAEAFTLLSWLFGPLGVGAAVTATGTFLGGTGLFEAAALGATIARLGATGVMFLVDETDDLSASSRYYLLVVGISTAVGAVVGLELSADPRRGRQREGRSQLSLSATPLPEGGALVGVAGNL